MVNCASKLAIREDESSENASDDWDEVWSVSNSGLPVVFLLEADGVDVDPLLTAFMPCLWDDNGFFP